MGCEAGRWAARRTIGLQDGQMRAGRTGAQERGRDGPCPRQTGAKTIPEVGARPSRPARRAPPPATASIMRRARLRSHRFALRRAYGFASFPPPGTAAPASI